MSHILAIFILSVFLFRLTFLLFYVELELISMNAIK